MTTIIKGQKWRFKGESGKFYTHGKVYEVLTEPRLNGDEFDLFQVTDDRGDQPHHWSVESLNESFERVDGPVRTVTRKEIVPGVYGRLQVQSDIEGYSAVAFVSRIDPDGDAVPFMSLKADELRAAASVLSELANALSQRTEEAGE